MRDRRAGPYRWAIVLSVGVLALLGAGACSVRSDSPTASEPDAAPTTSSPTTTVPTSSTTTTTGPQADPPQDPAPDVEGGAGEELVPLELPPDGAAFAHVVAEGPGDITMVVVDGGGRTIAELVDRTAPYDGRVLIDVEPGEEASLLVRSTGPWTVDVEPISAAPTFDGDYEGRGDDVMIYVGEPTSARISNGDSADLSVVVHGSGSRVRIANSGQVTTTVSLRRGLVEVRADGTWSFSRSG